MFDRSDTSRLFGEPCGVDFPKAVVEGLRTRLKWDPPEAIARVTLLVNTRRMQRRMVTLFDEGEASFLPKIKLITDLGKDPRMADIPPAISPLKRRLELSDLIGKLLESQPDLAPRAAIFDLADSLATLIDEMQGEGVSPARLRKLDVSNHSHHWARSLQFLDVVERFFGVDSEALPDAEARQRRVVERLISQWKDRPPSDPIIVAGSTGSRGTTRLLMEAVARLPQGAVILPGFDFDMTDENFADLEDGLTAEDHPQYRFAALMNNLGLTRDAVSQWSEMTPACGRRNALVSLALRPAPVTDQWLEEGPKFEQIQTATQNVTLLEAPSPRTEAAAIALMMREAAEDGRQVALISPDRLLTRQVSAALDRWRIEPDDSAGRPLSLSPPGRFLRMLVDLLGKKVTGPDLLALLKHPLTHSGHDRGDHLRFTRDLELEALRQDMAHPTPEAILSWSETRHEGDQTRQEWCIWIGSILAELRNTRTKPLADHVAQTLKLAAATAAGPRADGTGELWEKAAGLEALKITQELQDAADGAGTFSPSDFRDLFGSVIARGEVREPTVPHPNILIWGTLEARVQGVETVILGGLNEGVWPERPAPDPWMNRDMRNQAGLLLPERRIGLSAHDFQQAVAAPNVILSRSVRDAESETIPSRWINRLTNLLQGVSEDGRQALDEMRARGARWIELVNAQDRVSPVPPAHRPAPRPPVSARPKQLSVTNITKLVRDPYAVYARYVLGLKPLMPLHQRPDAPLRGTALHLIFEQFVCETPPDEDHNQARNRLMETARRVLEENAPWPAARLLWLSKIDRIADWFIETERKRSSHAQTVATEIRGRLALPDVGFTLTGTADRIDRAETGELVIYDYKTGSIPSEKQQKKYDKQLLLEALMAESGAFDGLRPDPVRHVTYIGVGSPPKEQSIKIDEDIIAGTREELCALIQQYQNHAQGYASRRIVEQNRFGGDFDDLARFGEWEQSDAPVREEVGA